MPCVLWRAHAVRASFTLAASRTGADSTLPRLPRDPPHLIVPSHAQSPKRYPRMFRLFA